MPRPVHSFSDLETETGAPNSEGLPPAYAPSTQSRTLAQMFPDLAHPLSMGQQGGNGYDHSGPYYSSAPSRASAANDMLRSEGRAQRILMAGSVAFLGGVATAAQATAQTRMMAQAMRRDVQPYPGPIRQSQDSGGLPSQPMSDSGGLHDLGNPLSGSVIQQSSESCDATPIQSAPPSSDTSTSLTTPAVPPVPPPLEGDIQVRFRNEGWDLGSRSWVTTYDDDGQETVRDLGVRLFQGPRGSDWINVGSVESLCGASSGTNMNSDRPLARFKIERFGMPTAQAVEYRNTATDQTYENHISSGNLQVGLESEVTADIFRHPLMKARLTRPAPNA